MENFTLNVPATSLVVESRGVSVTLDVAAIPHDVLRQVLLHGIKQKVADAASSAAGLVYFSTRGKDAPKPSREQLAAFVESNLKSVQDQTIASMQKAADAMLAGQWQVREASGVTVSKFTEEQALALDIAKGALGRRFADALAKTSPSAKPTAANFITLSPKVAAYFKANEKRPTWDDKAVLAWIAAQAVADKPRDIMAEARDELARRETASELMSADLDDMLGDI
jgi:hypothetical protein